VIEEPNKPSSDSTEHGDARRWLGQVCWVLAISALVTLAYAVSSESTLFRAAGLQLLLSLSVVWATLRMGQLPTTASHESRSIFIEKWSLHLITSAATLVVVLFGVIMSLLVSRVEVARPASTTEVAASAILAMLAVSLWTALTRMAHSTQPSVEADATTRVSYTNAMSPVTMSLHEARVVWFIVAGVQLAATVVPALTSWSATVVQVYLIVVVVELLLRHVGCWFYLEKEESDSEQATLDPLDCITREALLTSWNPLDTLFQIAERRFGLSLRSSWSIRYFRRATPIAIFATLVGLWLSTCLALVEPHQSALYESMGRVQPVPLSPGLHWIRPWPLGKVKRVSVGQVRTMQIGFEQTIDEKEVVSDQARSFLWTDPHANEFALVLGTQSELVSINAQIYYQVGSSTESMTDYLYRHANPEGALEALAYQVLREKTQSETLQHLLSENRQQFSDDIAKSLSEKVADNRLGIEIVSVSLLSLHPPVQVADAYLDVSNAERDALRMVTEARGNAQVKLLTAEKESAGLVAAAKSDASKRLGLAGHESSHFTEASKAFRVAPDTYRLRLWFDAYETALPGKKAYIIDSQLPDVLVSDPHSHLPPSSITTPPTDR